MIFKPHIPRALFAAFLLIFAFKAYFILDPAIGGISSEKTQVFVGPADPANWGNMIYFGWEESEVITEDQIKGRCDILDYKPLG